MTDHLANQAAQLTGAVTDLTTAIDHLARRQAHLRRVVLWTIAGLVVDVVLTVLVTVLYGQQQQASHRIADNTSRVQQVQDRTSNDVLCPLYKLFLDQEPIAVNNPALTPDQRNSLKAQFGVIHRGYDTLDCVH